MGTNKDPNPETKQVREVTENPIGPQSRISPKLSGEEIQASLKPLEKNGEMTRGDQARPGSPHWAVFTKSIFFTCLTGNQEKRTLQTCFFL